MSIIGKSIERDGLVVAKGWGKKGKLCICLLMCLYPCLCVCAVLSLEKEMATHPVFLPGESHGGRSLVGYSPWGCKESDMTERLHFHYT